MECRRIMGFRKVKPETRKIIGEWFEKQFTQQTWKEFHRGGVLLENEGRGTSLKIHRVDKTVYKFITSMEKRFKHVTAGVHVGNIRNEQFRITIGGALILGQLTVLHSFQMEVLAPIQSGREATINSIN